MNSNQNLIKLQNNLSKEFQQWKYKRHSNHQQFINDIEKSSLFYKSQKGSALHSPTKSPITPQTTGKSFFLQTHNGFFPTRVFNSSLKNFRKEIIKDSIKNQNHALNQVGQTQETIPFVPYIIERDKLGRLIKEQIQGFDYKQERSDINSNEVNIVDQITTLNSKNQYKVIENIINDDSRQYHSEFPLNSSQQEDEEEENSQKANYKLVKLVNHKKSHSFIPFGNSTNNLSSNQLDKIRSSSTLNPSMNNVSQNPSKIAFYSRDLIKIITQKFWVVNKLNQLLNGVGSFSQISMVQLSDINGYSQNPFMNPKSLSQLNIDHFEINQPPRLNNLLAPKTSITSLSQLNQNKSFTQLVQYNSQPCSPSRFITKIQSNNNSMHLDDKIIEFDKNNQLKCSQDELIRKIEAFQKRHMQARKKKEIQETQAEPYKFKAKVLPLKFPESAKASHACRVLFNHHKQIQKFNKMIDRNDPNILNFEIDHRKKNAEKRKNVMDKYKQRLTIAAGFIGKKKEINSEIRQQQKEEKRQQLLEKWGERVGSQELDDEEEKYRKKILNPILTKEQQIENERKRRQHIFNEYDKWYTLQMYYLDKGDKEYQI